MKQNRSSESRASAFPFVLLMHIPIRFPGVLWGPADVMGHPSWGAAHDPSAALEQRRPWPPAAPELVARFIAAVQRAAERQQLLAVLAGHTHEDGVAVVPRLDGGDSGVRQFTTRPNFAGCEDGM